MLLIIVLFFGDDNLGSNRWLYIGGFTFQPSEFSKVAVIIALARYYNDYHFISNNNILKVFFSYFNVNYSFFICNKPTRFRNRTY